MTTATAAQLGRWKVKTLLGRRAVAMDVKASACTLDDEVRPTASPISRTVGGYPRSRTVSEMNRRMRSCRAVSGVGWPV